MKTAGIIGGIGPESTIEYYRLMLAGYRARTWDESNPSIIINSIDVNRLLRLMESRDLKGVTEYLSVEVRRLASAGADFGLLAANTPHIVFDEVSRLSPIPLLSIVEATCEAAQALGLKKPALFGTRYTMAGRFYTDVFSREAIKLVLPDEEEQAYIHGKYVNELLKDIFLPETRERLLLIVGGLKEREGIDGLILGGTELPLILQDVSDMGIPFLDTTRIHVNAAVARLLA
ncbi:MAG TPA: amino acid racemase [Pyrinomonadaceae bacterium]|jgi:aspartate racemase|nr:amino acid racemase [Pyrinomonadaceae bacterium]